MDEQAIAKMIDHTLLKPTTGAKEIRQLCAEAKKFSFASVCINPVFVKLAGAELQESTVQVCTVIGFPLGAATSCIKGLEAEAAVDDGAAELDMVINIGFLKERQVQKVLTDIQTVVKAAQGKLVKVILETCLLTDEEKILGSQLAAEAGAQFVKTSTGFSIGGATILDVRLLRETVGPNMGVKAAGGVRSYQDMLKMIKAGATRIGTSAGVAIMENVLGGRY